MIFRYHYNGKCYLPFSLRALHHGNITIQADRKTFTAVPIVWYSTAENEQDQELSLGTCTLIFRSGSQDRPETSERFINSLKNVGLKIGYNEIEGYKELDADGNVVHQYPNFGVYITTTVNGWDNQSLLPHHIHELDRLGSGAIVQCDTWVNFLNKEKWIYPLVERSIFPS